MGIRTLLDTLSRDAEISLRAFIPYICRAIVSVPGRKVTLTQFPGHARTERNAVLAQMHSWTLIPGKVIITI